MSTEDEKKKYWCDQIKSMIGPCMITIAIPMMIPGFTITFVAFAEKNAFPKYGALHVVGIIILGIAFILLLLGCLLRFHWKPFISPDLEMHLSPMGSARHLRSDRSRSGSLKGEKVKDPQSENNSKSRQNGLATERDRMDNIPPKTEVKPESETDGTASESELRKSLTGSIERKFDIISSPRSRNLRPVNTDSFDEDSNDAGTNHFEVVKSYEALQEFRRKKKRGKKRNQKEKLSDNETVISKTLVSESLYEINQNKDQNTKSTQNSECESDKKKKKNKESENRVTETSNPVETEKQSNNNTVEKKTKRKKKKKKVLNSLRNEQERSGNKNSQILSSMYASSDVHNNQNEEHDSDQSNVSIGSVDSVLAQYTSRSSKSQKDIP